jgi:hypothetical protein
MDTTDDHVARIVYDRLVVRHGVEHTHAAQLAQEVLAILTNDRKVEVLYAVKILDYEGAPHAVVTAAPRLDQKKLFRFDIRAMRVEGRRRVLEELDCDLAPEETPHIQI